MAIHRKEDLVPDSNENGITMTSLSGPERGDKMITVKELFLEPGAEIPVHLQRTRENHRKTKCCHRKYDPSK